MTALKHLPLAALLALAPAAHAQDETTPSADPGLDMGQQVSEELSYIKETYDDWQLQCFRSEADEDPCQMYQLLREDAGNPVAEFSIFKLPDEAAAAAGATIVVPLGTLLLQGLKVSVDDGLPKVYNFSFCSMVGCFARIGFTDEEIEDFKSGENAVIEIVPAQAPNEVVTINASLKGFTKAFENVSIAPN
jgi:invasion protein IalB